MPSPNSSPNDTLAAVQRSRATGDSGGMVDVCTTTSPTANPAAVLAESAVFPLPSSVAAPAGPMVAAPTLATMMAVEPHFPPTPSSAHGPPGPLDAALGAGMPPAAIVPEAVVAGGATPAFDDNGQPLFTFAMAATAEAAGVGQTGPAPPPADNDGFVPVRSKKRARINGETKAGRAAGRAAPYQVPMQAGGTSNPGPRAVGGRRGTAPAPDGVARFPRQGGATSPLGFEALMRMSPMEEGQLFEQRQPAAPLGLNTFGGAALPPNGVASPVHHVPIADGGASPPLEYVVPGAPRLRNATPGPSAPQNAGMVGERAVLRALAPAFGQENIPPLPSFVRDMSPILRLQTLEFLGRIPERARDNLIGAADHGGLPGPALVSGYPNGFWPEAVQWLNASPWLWMNNAPGLVGPGPEPVIGGDHPMEAEAGAPGTPVLAALPGMDDVAQLPPLDDPEPPLIIDIQNLALLPNCVPNGGRQTNNLFPIPRAHVHGAAQIQPPYEITQTPEPLEGFPRIRHGDPEALYAGWEVERIRHVSFLDPDTTVIASVHAPVAIHAGEGWDLVQAVQSFVASICGEAGVFVVPVEVQTPAPRFVLEDVQTWPPTSFPVWNLPREAARGFVAQQSFSTTGLTIHFFSTRLRLDDLLGRIEGFTRNDPLAITAFIKSRLESEEVRTILRKYVARNPRRNTAPIEVAVQTVIDSLRVEIETLPPKNQPNALVFLDSPIDTIDGLRAFRKDMKTVHWKSLDYGTGILIYLPPCRGCGSVAHRTENCPFPDLPGWLGPTHAEVARAGARPGGRGRGTFFGGRGRGRAPFRG